jgi:branched-chain amino acid transport system permease protein
MNIIEELKKLPITLRDLISNTVLKKEFYQENWKVLLILFLMVLYPLIPSLFQIDYLIHIAIVANIFAIIAIAWDVNGGYTGQSNLATGFFAGMCGYTSAILTLDYALPIAASWLVGMGISFLAALAIGFPALRIKGPYLTIVTFSVAEVARLLTIFFSGVTRGEEGVGGIPKLFDDILVNYYWTFFVLIGVVILTKLIIGSQLGLAFKAIAEDEVRAKTLGIDITKYKIISFSICGLIAGFGGAMYAHYQAHIDPHFFSIAFAISVISMAAIGGEKTLVGAIIGSYLLQFSAEGLRFVTGPDLAWFRLSIHGVLLLVVMLFLPEGLLSLRHYFQEEKPEIVGKMVCEVCGVEYPIPLCCGEQMVQEGEFLSCCKGTDCKKQDIPMHCDQKMKVILGSET